MTHKPGPAEAEEQAELQAIRDRASADARQAGDTLAALAGKLSESARPPVLARRAAATARAQAWQATWRLAQRYTATVRGRLTIAVAVPAGIIVIAVAGVLWQRRRAG